MSFFSLFFAKFFSPSKIAHFLFPSTFLKIPALFFTTLSVFGRLSFASDLLNKMSLEEKVGQVLMVHFHGEEVNEEARVLIEELKVGAIIYYNWSNGLSSPGQIQALSHGLQKLAANTSLSLPLLIATDQEGGAVTRLVSGFTLFPGNRALGAVGDSTLVEESAWAMGNELGAVGINMNLAPVVDINSNPKNPIIGLRSFGSDPKTVIDCGKKALLGFKRARVIATLKHFPGCGDLEIDPHEDLPMLHASKEALEACELQPFSQLAPLADAIMTAHVVAPALDAKACVTLSKPALNYLRETIGFQGVIISDSLVMNGVLKGCGSVEEAAMRALDAGCDLLILGGKLLDASLAERELTLDDLRRVHHSLVEAVKSEKISEERLNQAVAKVLELKERCLPHSCPHFQSEALKSIIATPYHLALADEIASKAIRVIEKKGASLPLFSAQRVLIVAPDILKSSLLSSSFSKISPEVRFSFFSSAWASSREKSRIEEEAKHADILMICSYNSWKTPALFSWIDSLLSQGKPSLALVLRDPLDAAFFSRADLIVLSFSSLPPSLEAVARFLIKKYSPPQNLFLSPLRGSKEALELKRGDFLQIFSGHRANGHPLTRRRQTAKKR